MFKYLFIYQYCFIYKFRWFSICSTQSWKSANYGPFNLQRRITVFKKEEMQPKNFKKNWKITTHFK